MLSLLPSRFEKGEDTIHTERYANAWDGFLAKHADQVVVSSTCGNAPHLIIIISDSGTRLAFLVFCLRFVAGFVDDFEYYRGIIIKTTGKRKIKRDLVNSPQRLQVSEQQGHVGYSRLHI